MKFLIIVLVICALLRLLRPAAAEGTRECPDKRARRPHPAESGIRS
ncbi:hypothetical protein [Niabella terrae]